MSQIPRILSSVFEQGANIARHISLDHIQKKFDNTFAVFEEGLNIAGYVPFFGVSMVSGLIRVEYGKAQICGSIALAALVAIASLFNRNAGTRQQGLKLASTIARTYSLHGFANMGRGCIEMIRYFSLMTCLPYDMTNNRYRYPTEVPGRWEYVTQA